MPDTSPEKAFAVLGTFEQAPIASVAKRIDKLLKKFGKQLADVLEPDVDEPPTTAWFLRGKPKPAADLAIKNKRPGVYVIDGDLQAKHSISFDSSATTVVFVTGSLTTTHLRVTSQTILLVEGSLAADQIVYDSFGFVVGGKAVAKHVFIYGDYEDPQLGKQPKGVVHTCYEHELIGDVESHVLWKRMTTGKKFLVG